MNHKVITLLICLFSMQGLMNGRFSLGFLPQQLIWIGHLIIMFVYFKVTLNHLTLYVKNKLKRRFDLVEILLIVSLMYGFYLMIVKNTPILAGLIGIKNLLLFPMIYVIIRREKRINFSKLLSVYKYILLLQIPIYLYQGLKLNWAAEQMTGTWGFHTTGINGVIYTAVVLFGITYYIYTKEKKALLLLSCIIFNGISGVRATFLLLFIGIATLVFYQLLFVKKKFSRLLIMLLIIIPIILIADYSHLYFEGIKISTLFINKSSSMLRAQIIGYGVVGSSEITHFGRITSLFFVWTDLIQNNILLTGHGPGLAREEILGGAVSVKEAFVFKGSAGGFAPIWYEFGSIGIILYFQMIMSCILSFIFISIRNKSLRNDPYLIWGIVISVLFLFGSLYTNMWHIYSAFHYWLFMGLIFRNIEGKTKPTHSLLNEDIQI